MLQVDWSGFNAWLMTFFKMSIGSGLIIIVKSIYTYVKKIYARSKAEDSQRDEALDLLKNAVMAQQHDTLYRLTDEYLNKGFITLAELDNLEYIFESYKALGGNGSGEYRYNKCRELPLKSGKDHELEALIKDHRGGGNDE
nr:MAG TPA: holin protein [Caudoviricetes sp.]